MQRKLINQPVAVTAVYFRRRDFDTYPRRIEFDGRSIKFKTGIRYLIGNGEKLTRLFDMSDGESQYRLREQAGGWTLVTISR